MKLDKTYYNKYIIVLSNTHISPIWEIVAPVVLFGPKPYWWQVLVELGRCSH
jgi:hypothetical protein